MNDRGAELFKSEGKAREYLAAYEDVLSLWPVPYETQDVPTEFGVTHITISGPKDAQPLFLFPGFGSNSTMWFANIGTLARPFRVYAVDTPGQPGKSLPSEPLVVANTNEWIAQMLDALQIEQAHVMGVSLGGWLAMDFAIHHPGRIGKVALLDPPATFVRLSGAFVRHSLIPFMVYPTRNGLIRFFRWLLQGYAVNRQYGEIMVLGVLNTRPQPPIQATVFSDAELKSMARPVLLLVGDRSVIYDPQEVICRATELLPDVEAEIVTGASHALIMEQADFVNRRVVEFLVKQG